MPGGRPKSDAKERFRAKIKMMETGCHEWQSVLHWSGYGKFYHEGRQALAHRAAYDLFVSPIPEGLFVLHQCDNRKCVNPDHLFLGTQRDNVEDRDRKGRAGKKTKPDTKLSAEQIQEVHRLLGDRYSQREIADRYGVHQTTISRLRQLRLTHDQIG